MRSPQNRGIEVRTSWVAREPDQSPEENHNVVETIVRGCVPCLRRYLRDIAPGWWVFASDRGGYDNRYQIGNNRGHVNGWISAAAIFGRCVRVET